MTTVALFGAAGKVGTRITHALKDDPEYRSGWYLPPTNPPPADR